MRSGYAPLLQSARRQLEVMRPRAGPKVFHEILREMTRLATSSLCGAEIQIRATSTTTRTTSPIGL
jgi:hypothetical protein